jgi:iron(III) transport system permease protein
VLLLDYYEGGNTGKAAAFSLVQTVLLALVIGIAGWISSWSANSSMARSG